MLVAIIVMAVLIVGLIFNSVRIEKQFKKKLDNLDNEEYYYLSRFNRAEYKKYYDDLMSELKKDSKQAKKERR